ncbi:DUF2927 domain-containing protein [Alkalihalobacillus sp. AL-G]|uniref:DUF2927 domain-containing protein n=1 Tax=Alkalihalobacillus sp. AL-G TaxID=2926399 RepID=UPI00272B820B|nr:DUF2927 domain-containing protein [Alkalihalobacillus sp. AL-G]WLD94603.1 DUF2927 domain-containing protein [Alkalihalobacillus sp. AL-G]
MRKVFIFLSLLILMLSGCIPEPEIHIEGVKDGEVYVKDRIIEIDENRAGEYTLKLNGETIQNGHTVSENDDYKLTITAKRWWNEQTKSIQFEIDDIPPNKPSFKDEPKEVYYKQAKFSLEKEEDVMYKVKMDDKPYDINNPVTEEGEHKLFIKAVKDNGLLAQKEVEFVIDNRTYTRKAVDTFKHFIFHSEEQQDQKVLKWTKNASVYIYGNPTGQDREALESYFNRINELLPIDLLIMESDIHSTGDYSLSIFFVPSHKFKDYGFKGDLENGNKRIVGFAAPTKVSEEGILRSIIVIGTDTDQRFRKTTILHEIVHSLGLYGHFNNNEHSILYPYNNNMVTELTDMDKKMIEILYRPGIHTGMDESDVERVLKTRIKE